MTRLELPPLFDEPGHLAEVPREPTRVIVSLSGGKDSVASLLLALEIFGPDRFYIEVQKQGIQEQDIVNPELADLANKLGCGLVATNDVHFLNKEDHHAHDVLCCISMGRLITDEGRLKYPTELYLKSPEEMSEALAAFPQAIENTVRIAQMCDLD